MMKNNYLKNICNIIKYNFKTLIRFEFLFKLALALILMPLAILGFNLTMKLTGYSYLTLENITGFLLNPITIFLLLIIIIFLTIITMFDISTLIIIFDTSYHNKKVTTLDAIKISLNKCKNIFKLKNISVAFLVLFIIPFLNIGISSNLISSIKIPEFIMDYINSNKTLLLLYIAVYIFLLSLLSKWIYSLHYMIIENNNFKEARNNSKFLIKGNIFKDGLKILLAQLILAVLYILFLLIGIALILLINKLLAKLEILQSVIITIIWLFTFIALFIFSIISNGISYAIISTLFYKHKEEKREEIIPIKYERIVKNKKHSKIIETALIIIAVITIGFGSLFTYQVVTGKANLKIEFIRNMEITAHRGASTKYPENTMAAFRGAKELGADWIELDVQQTKDKQIVVCHDTNLKRVTGVNKEIIDLTYEEISKLDAGSNFDKRFKDERIPLLSEVLKYANNNNIRLNIELKPVGKEVDFEKQIVDLIKEYNMEDRCVVTSQVYDVLENTKKYDKNIKTVYVMSIAIGNITDLEYADAFSIEATNVTESQVNRVHNAGKELYAWTINTEESINHMIDMNVDNIITDNIELGKELVEKSKSGNVIVLIFKMLNE